MRCRRVVASFRASPPACASAHSISASSAALPRSYSVGTETLSPHVAGQPWVDVGQVTDHRRVRLRALTGRTGTAHSLTRQRAPGPPQVKGPLRRFAPLTCSSPGTGSRDRERASSWSRRRRRSALGVPVGPGCEPPWRVCAASRSPPPTPERKQAALPGRGRAHDPGVVARRADPALDFVR